MSNNYKQIIILRKDLNMRKGKMIAQGAHASVKAVIENLNRPECKEWLKGKFTKIAVSVESEKELFEIYNEAKSQGMITSLILDSGLTEFGGNATYTAVAIGPDESCKIDEITGKLKLL